MIIFSINIDLFVGFYLVSICHGLRFLCPTILLL